MSKLKRSFEQSKNKAFISIFFIFASLLVSVFFQMEVRKMGYQVLRNSQNLQEQKDLLQDQKMILAELTRPQRVRHLAQSRLTLESAKQGQIIQLSSGGIPFLQ